MRTGKKEREEGQREEAKKTQKKETKKEQKKEQKKGLKKEQNRKRDKGESPFRRAAMFLYKQACVRKLPLFASRQVESDLVQLHPGENIPWIRTEYYVKKLSLTLVILFVGFLFGAAAKAAAGKDLLLQEDGGIPRGNYLDGEREIQVTADLGDYSQEFTVNLHPRLLTDEELETLWKEFEDRLPEWIKGENENLQRVTEDLVLQESYDGFPFQVEWESDRPDVLGSDGAVGAVTEQTETDLRAKISCQDFIEEMCIRVTPGTAAQGSGRVFDSVRGTGPRRGYMVSARTMGGPADKLESEGERQQYPALDCGAGRSGAGIPAVRQRPSSETGKKKKVPAAGIPRCGTQTDIICGGRHDGAQRLFENCLRL